MPDTAARDLAGKLIAFLETALGPPTAEVVPYSFADLGKRCPAYEARMIIPAHVENAIPVLRFPRGPRPVLGVLARDELVQRPIGRI